MSAASSIPAPASSTNENAICVVGEDPQAAVGARRDPNAAARQAEARRRVWRRQPRDVGEHHGRGDRQAGADPEHAGVDSDVERANGEAARRSG